MHKQKLLKNHLYFIKILASSDYHIGKEVEVIIHKICDENTSRTLIGSVSLTLPISGNNPKNSKKNSSFEKHFF